MLDEPQIMKLDTPIVVFAYSFPHKKSFDFITILAEKGYRNLLVIAAPKLVLNNNLSKNSKNHPSEDYDVQKLCSSLNIKFVESAHDDIEQISKVRTSFGAEIAIISGARILSEDIIELFPSGIVNFHPGKIPETSGLDSYFYTLKTGSPMGITVHLIDKRVDAGSFIFFEKLPIEHEDTFDSLKSKLYMSQLTALNRYLDIFFNRDDEYENIYRPKKNNPMNVTEKETIKEDFFKWQVEQMKLQKDIEKKFFDMCKKGALFDIKKLISENMYLLNKKNSKGWSGIIIAAYEQHEELVKYLLSMGANPNDRGENGTSVLMYAKTKLLESESPSLTMLSLLISNGADPSAMDKYGKTIFDYLDLEKKSAKLIKKFLQRDRLAN